LRIFNLFEAVHYGVVRSNTHCNTRSTIVVHCRLPFKVTNP